MSCVRAIVLIFSINFVSVGIPILIFFLYGKPYQRGFYCYDESIKYPFKESTVTNTMLYIVGLFLPITVVSVNSANGSKPIYFHQLTKGNI